MKCCFNLQGSTRTYAVKHLVSGKEPAYDESWEHRDHNLTVVIAGINDVGYDELFFDSIPVHSQNWKWIHQYKELVFAQGSQEGYIGGHLGFHANSSEAAGGVQLGSRSKVESVRLSNMSSTSSGGKGLRNHVETEPSELTLTVLLSMNPFGSDAQGNSAELVQRSSMEGFYKIIQYYMPEKLLKDFIAAEPPDLGDIKDIADDSSANKPFYSSLATPYLSSALKSADRDSVKKLNARRAQAALKQKTSVDAVYREQSARLYTHEWVKKFPKMSLFLEDQRNNTAEQHATINKEAEKWIASIRKGMEHVDKHEREQLQQMIDIAENGRAKGLNSLYWAFILFRYLCSDGFLTMLKEQMTEGNTSQVVTQNIQRYSSVLSVLDPSTYFTHQFVQVMQIQQLTALLPSFLDISSDWQDTTFFMQLIIDEFLKKYVNSPDPAIRKRVQEVQEALDKNTLRSYLKILASVSLIGSKAWNNLAVRFRNAAVKKFGKLANGAAELMLSAVTAFAVLKLCTGMIKWADLSVADRANIVAGCLSIVTTLVRKGIEAVVSYRATSSLWEALKVFVYKDIVANQRTLTTFFGRWVTNNVERVSPRAPIDLGGLFFEEAEVSLEDYPRFCKYFGNGLREFMATRFAAAMAILGVILSVIGIVESTTPVQYALNTMFLLSAILDFTAAAAEWAISVGVEELGALSLTFLSSLAGPLAIFAAFVGVILMIINSATTKTPPNPIDEFVGSGDVDKDGFYMKYEASIEYFQVINDKSKMPRDIGVAFKPKSIALYLVVNSDGSLSCGPLSHGYDTVLSVSTDYKGQSYILTQIWQKKKNSDSDYTIKVVALTLNDNNQLSMVGPISDDKQKDRQLWTAICVGDVNNVDDDHLKSASFTIENVHSKGKYLSVSSTAVTVAASATPWTLSMEPMKPARLTFLNVHLYTLDRDRVFYPDLGQKGSLSNMRWSVMPALPDFLTFDQKTGTISQKKGLEPPLYSSHPFTMQVTNDYGSASANFTIVVTTDPEIL